MKNILIVDTNEQARRFYRDILTIRFGDSQLSIDDICCWSAACDFVARNSPDLVLMTIGKEYTMNGIEATKVMRSQNYQGYIILCSSFDYPVELLKRVGATEFLDEFDHKNAAKVIAQYLKLEYVRFKPTSP